MDVVVGVLFGLFEFVVKVLVEVVGGQVWVKYGWIDVLCFVVLGILVVNYGLGDFNLVYCCDEWVFVGNIIVVVDLLC